MTYIFKERESTEQELQEALRRLIKELETKQDDDSLIIVNVKRKTA